MIENEIIQVVTSEVIEQVLSLVHNDVYKMYLYGSYARGDFSAESDIDIMIILNCSKEQVKSYRKAICKIASRIGLKNDIEVSLVLRDKESFEAGLRVLPFYRNVVEEGVSIYG